jgi:hypothetical protein
MGIVDQFKELAALAQKVQNIELYEKLVSFQSDMFALQEENRNLKDSIRQLQDQLNLKARVFWERPFYWVNKEGQKDGPFCQKCYDSDNKLIRLQQRETRDEWDCLECGKYFQGPGYFPPKNTDPYNPYDM